MICVINDLDRSGRTWEEPTSQTKISNQSVHQPHLIQDYEFPKSDNHASQFNDPALKSTPGIQIKYNLKRTVHYVFIFF